MGASCSIKNKYHMGTKINLEYQNQLEKARLNKKDNEKEAEEEEESEDKIR